MGLRTDEMKEHLYLVLTNSLRPPLGDSLFTSQQFTHTPVLLIHEVSRF
jgi:hypothetical protein